MLHFLHPLWLWAMAGMAIPVVLHLWNERRAKVLPVGSVFLLQGATRRLSVSFRFSRLLLLLLRCLLILLLAFLLAGPVFTLPAGEVEKGWVLVAGDAVQSGNAGASGDAGRGGNAGVSGNAGRGRSLSVVDSLIKAGYKRKVLQDSNYWEAFVRADREAPAGIPFYIITTGELIHFGGVRPETERSVRWEVVADSAETHWIGGAWKTSSDSVAVSSGTGTSTGTVYRHSVQAEADRYDTALHIVIAADRGADGHYLEAGIKAIGEYTKRKMVVRVVDAGKMMGEDVGMVTRGDEGKTRLGDGGKAVAGKAGETDADWLFWLSERPVPQEKYSHVWRYAVGKEKKVDTWMEGVEVKKEIDGAPVGGSVAGRLGEGAVTGDGMSEGGAVSGGEDDLKNDWRDGFGRSVLSKEGTGFQFYSRLDPDWNGLVWDPKFPILLQGLLFGKDSINRLDRRVLDPVQIAPLRKKAGAVAAEHREWNADFLCWLLLLLVFVLERIVSFFKND